MTLKHANWLRERVLKVTFREAMGRFHILSPCPGMVHVLRLRNNGFIVGPEELFSSWTLARIKFIPSLDQYGCSSIKWSYDAIISSGLLSFAQSRLDSLANEKLTLRGKGKEDILLACMQVSVSPTTTKNKKTNCLRNPDFFQHQWSLYTFIFFFLHFNNFRNFWRNLHGANTTSKLSKGTEARGSSKMGKRSWREDSERIP